MSSWSNLSDEEKNGFVIRRYTNNESIESLASELGMNPISLNRRLQEHKKLKGDSMSEKKQTRNPRKYKEYKPIDFNAAVFDIETTDFSAGGWNAHFVCGVILPLGAKTSDAKVFQIDFEDNRNDRMALMDFVTELNNYRILIGHYITGFDIPYLNSRLAFHQIPLQLNRPFVYDTYQASRRISLRSHRKSLAFLTDFFGIKNLKSSIYPTSWSNIDSNDEEEFLFARNDIVTHCIGDVTNNREIFNALFPLDRSIISLPVYKK